MSLKVDRVELEIVIKNDENRKRLREIEDDIRNVQKELKKAKQGTEEWADADKRLKALKLAHDEIYNKIGLTNLSLKELNRRQQELSSILAQVPGDSPLYKKYNDQLNDVKGRIRELKGTAQETHFSLGKMADGFNRYFAMATAFAASLTGIAMGFKALKEERDKMEDSKANLKALTGLGQEDVDRLTEMAKKMSVNALEGTGIRIRQSAQEIVDAYTKVGSQKPELLKDADALNEVTKQALILATASKMEVVPAAEGLTNMMNQYGVSASEAAHYMNVLAAGSQAGAKEVPYISEAMTKFGSVAKLANVPVEQAVALIETLGEKGHAAEISGTGLKTFFVKLMKGADETNPRVVGMTQALETLNTKFSGKGGFSKMAELFGIDNVVIAQTIIDQRKRFEELTTAVTGTAVGMEQAAINSTTPAAKMAQSVNQMKIAGIELVNKLQPAMSMLTGWFSKTVQALPGLVDWFGKWGGTIVTTTVIIGAYIVAIQAQTIATKIAVIWNEKLEASFNSIKNFIKTNPYAAGLIGLTALVVMIEKFINRNNELKDSIKETLKDSQRDYRAQVELEKSNANGLFEAYKNANEGTEQRRIALTKIKSLYGPYIQDLIDEKGNIKDIAKAQQQVNTALEQNIAIKITDAAKTKILEKSIGEQTDLLTELSKRMGMIKGEDAGNIFADQISSIFRQYGSDLVKAEQVANGLAMRMSQGQGLQFRTILQDRISQYKESITVQQKGLADLDKQFNRVKPAISSKIENNNTTNSPDNSGQTPEDKLAELKKAHDEELKKQEDAYKKQQALLITDRTQNKKTEEQYQNEMEVLDLQYLENKAKMLKGWGENTGDIELQIANKKLEIQKKTTADLEKLFKDYEKKRKEDTDLALKKLETDEEAEKVALDQKKNDRLISEKQYKEGLVTIEAKYLQKKLDLEKSPMDLVIAEQNKELALLNEKHVKKLISEEVYQAEVMRIQSDAFVKQLILAGMSAEKAEELRKKMLANGIKSDDTTDRTKERSAFTDKYGTEEQRLKSWKQKEAEIIQDWLQRGIITKEEAVKAEALLDKEYNLRKIDGYAKAAQEIGNIAGNLANAASGFQQVETQAVEMKYAKLIKAAGTNQKKVAKLEEQKEKELAEVRRKWADKQFILTAAQIVAQTAVAAITAYTSALNVPIIGPVLAPIAAAAAVAAGTAQLAVANQAREQAKSGLYSGGYSGDYVEGYTRRGNSRAEAGVIPVHSNEFVGNNDGVANPHVNQFYDIFNNAQKTGRIRMMNTTEILQNIRVRGMYDGGYSQTNRTTAQESGLVNGVPQSNNTMDTNRLTDVLTRLEAKMDKPMRGIVSITGREGLKEQTALYDRMIAAKSR